MTLSLSQTANGAVHQMFTALDAILAKAAAAAQSKGVDEAVFLDWRLAPDMFALMRQVRIATELPARALSRLAGADMPQFADDEASFEDLRGRIKKAHAHIAALSEEAINAEPETPITFPSGPGVEMSLPRKDYLLFFILPNLYFHVTTTYAILRRLGVDIGKRDYLAAPQ